VAEIGVEDSFLDLGGDSLLATRLLARLRQELAVQLPVDRLFERPTVAAVAALVVESAAHAADAANVAGEAGAQDVARLVAEIHGLSAAQLEEELATAERGAGSACSADGETPHS
jgi:acyl carrier protein